MSNRSFASACMFARSLLLFADPAAAACGDGHCAAQHGENCETCAVDCRCAADAIYRDGHYVGLPGGTDVDFRHRGPDEPQRGAGDVGPAGWCCREPGLRGPSATL